MLHQNLIAGEWMEGVAVNRDLNPSNLDDVVGEYARADARQAETAIDAAHEAFKTWSRATPEERSDVLDRIGTEILARKDEIGRLLSREEGKTLPEGIGETVRAGRIFKFFAGEALRIGGEKIPSVRAGVEVEITREPEGVVGIITPWNFPDRDPGLEDRAGARLRQLRRVQARRPRAGLRLGACRHHLALRHPGRRLQPRDGLGLAGRQRHRALAEGQGGELHRLGRHRPQGRGRLRRPRRQGAARDGRQEPDGRASTTPISASRSGPASTAPSSRPASAARRRAGSSCSPASTTSSSTPSARSSRP